MIAMENLHAGRLSKSYREHEISPEASSVNRCRHGKYRYRCSLQPLSNRKPPDDIQTALSAALDFDGRYGACRETPLDRISVTKGAPAAQASMLISPPARTQPPPLPPAAAAALPLPVLQVQQVPASRRAVLRMKERRPRRR